MQRSRADAEPGAPGDRSIERMASAAPAPARGPFGGAPRPGQSRLPLVLLALSAAALVAAQVLMPEALRPRAIVTSVAGMVAGIVAAGVVLQASRRPDAWASTRRYGLALVAIALVQAGFLVAALVGRQDGPYGRNGLPDLAIVGMGALLLPLFWSELRDHFPRGDRREVLADIVLLAAASGTLVYLIVRPDPPQPMVIWLSAVLWTAVVMTGVVAWTALAMWLPSRVHIGLSAFVTCLGVSGLAF